jgi:Spy/CpxP family protein refolding chaperone
MIGLSSTRNARALAAVVLAATFAAGAAAGMAFERVYHPNPLANPGVVTAAMLSAPVKMPTELARLDLSDAQRQQILGLLAGSRSRTMSVFQRMVPLLADIADSTDEAVRAVLSPAQRAALGNRGRYRMLRVTRDGDGDGDGARRVDTLPETRRR